MAAIAAPGLTQAEAERRLAERGPAEGPSTSRTYRSIIRENTFTLFNLILGVFAVALIATGQVADLVFALILIVNAGIGILQEIRAKRQLDRLALLVAPRARVLRDGEERSLLVEDVVAGDAIRLGPGEQVVADGTLTEARGLQLDESVLTGEADPVARRTGETIQSGSFCVAGSGIYLAEKVGADAYANELVGQAQTDRQPLSPLQKDINRLLRLLVLVMIPVGGAFIVALHVHDTPVRQAVSEATAGIVSLVPEGLVLLASVTFAIAAGRMARRGALVQRLNAIESLAGVDVVCVDKTGTLTDGTLSLDEVVPLAGTEDEARALLGRFATNLGGRNPTADAIAAAIPGEPGTVAVEVPFSSRWKWSGLELDDGERLVLGAPDVLAEAAGLDPGARQAIEQRAAERKRVLLLARAGGPLAEPAADESPALPPLIPIALAVLSERMRGDAATTVGFLIRQGIDVKVISGDGPTTVAAVATAAGIDTVDRVTTGPELPDHDEAALRHAADHNRVFARIAPEQKKHLVDALAASGRRIAMVGDGVNDVPALKRSDVAVALGSGSQIAKGVADLVLVSLNFSAIPASIGEGRKILKNVQRVAKLFVTKSIFAAVLILTVGIGGGAYPFLPRQLSLAAAFTVGIPAFALALAPPGPDGRSRSFIRDVFLFAIPAGAVLGFAVLLGHGLVHTSLGRSAEQSQTTSTTILVLVGLYIVLVLESSSMRQSAFRARAVPALCGALAIAYFLILAWEPAREFFALAEPSALPITVSIICTIFAIGALGALGLSLTRPGGEEPQLVAFWNRGNNPAPPTPTDERTPDAVR